MAACVEPVPTWVAAVAMAALLALPLPLHGADLDARLNAWVAPVAEALASVVFFSVPVAGVDFPLIVGWLIVAALVCTLAFRFVQLRRFVHALRIVRGDYADPRDAGEVSHFQALATAVSGTVGLGNIAGVGVAVAIGGPGATFWMIVAGLLGMASKFTECTLGVTYRITRPDGSVAGGPMHYLSRGLAERGLPRLGHRLALVFAVCCVAGALGGGNMFQANQAYQQVLQATGGDSSWLVGRGWLFGLVLAVLVGVVIIGGIRSIARVTARLVPFMALLYLGAALIIISLHADRLVWAFGEILRGAFTGEGVAGGVIGALIQGVRRAAFSNEAGIGSAAIAHAAVRTREPVTEGYVALLEPFIDTVVICTLTALVIVISGALATELSGVQLTSAAFATVWPWFPAVLSVVVLLFAYSTMITWAYYGQQAWDYVAGHGPRRQRLYQAGFCVFVVLGCTMELDAVIAFSDAMIFLMAIPNVIGLYLLLPVVQGEMARYEARRARGEIRRVRPTS